jgi:S-adenosylmethionine-diacylgycerolhomoserine-N-methlytransferase
MTISASDPAHATLMDQVYRRQRYFYDLTRKYYLFGRDRLIRELSLPANAAIVEVGCGTARNLIKIARRFPTARLYGLDASAEMLKTAAAAVERAGLSDRIVLRQGYAEELVPELFDRRAPFDAAIFSYSLSMIPDWQRALQAASRALNAGGKLHIVDFGDLGRAGMTRNLLRRWLALFHVEPREELLGSLEQHAAGAALRTLPFRYAFLFSGDRNIFSS